MVGLMADTLAALSGLCTVAAFGLLVLMGLVAFASRPSAEIRDRVAARLDRYC